MTEATVKAGAVATAIIELVRGEVKVVPTDDDVVVVFDGRWAGISR